MKKDFFMILLKYEKRFVIFLFYLVINGKPYSSLFTSIHCKPNVGSPLWIYFSNAYEPYGTYGTYTYSYDTYDKPYKPYKPYNP